MTYIRTSRAAVAVAPVESSSGNLAHGEEDHRPRPGTVSSSKQEGSLVQTLWASRPLTVRAGRLVAVRLRGDDLRVGLAAADGLRWVSPEGVVTAAQAMAWSRMSRFSRTG